MTPDEVRGPRYDSHDTEAQPYNVSVPQGFNFRTSLRHDGEIASSTHHVRIPVHYMDGILIHDTEEDTKTITTEAKRVMGEQDEEDFEDRVAIGPARTWMVATVDSKSYFTSWDLATLEKKTHQRLPYNISHIVFISKNYMFAGVTNGNLLKFFTPKLDFTSGKSLPHYVNILKYNEATHEIIAVGTHVITIWSLNAVYFAGVIKIEVKLRLTMETKLSETEFLDNIYIQDRTNQLFVTIDTSFMVILCNLILDLRSFEWEAIRICSRNNKEKNYVHCAS